MVAASAALTFSGVPFMGPIGGARVGYINGGYVLNPTGRPGEGIQARPRRRRHRRCGADGGIGGARAFRGRDARRRDVRPPLLPAGDRRDHPLAERAAKEPRQPRCRGPDGALRPRPPACCATSSAEPTRSPARPNATTAIDAAKAKVKEALCPAGATDAPSAQLVGELFKKVESEIVRGRILDDGRRIDGRDLRTVRPIVCEVGLLPRTHGSALFTRGETQALVVATLGTGEDEQMIDSLEGTYKERFMLHYNFPPYSVGETGRMGSPGRREVGHGKLAWRAIRPILPANARVPLHAARRLRDHRVERLVLDGDGLRNVARADGRRRAAEGAGRRHRHGPDQGGRALRRPLRHPRRRGPSRRHGLQGRRHRERRHLAADGHQDPGHQRGDHAQSRSTRRRTAACTSSARWARRSDMRAPSSASMPRASRC